MIECEPSTTEPLNLTFYNGSSFLFRLYIFEVPSISHLYGVCLILRRSSEKWPPLGRAMRLKGKNPISLDVLDNALRNAQRPSLDLLSKIINGVFTRIHFLARAESLNRITRLAEMGAWTEATLALIQLELPSWIVRRLAYENGEWLCSLSQQPNLPMALDDCAEASHEVLPLAILCAFLEACRRRHGAQESVPAVPQVAQSSVDHIICCENYR